MKYRYRPKEVEAIQFVDEPKVVENIARFVGFEVGVNRNVRRKPYLCIYHEKDSCIIVENRNYIIKEANGDIWTCEPDMFDKIFDIISEK